MEMVSSVDPGDMSSSPLLVSNKKEAENLTTSIVHNNTNSTNCYYNEKENDGYWWTHGKLLEEAAPPDITAAEEVSDCLKLISQLAQKQFQKVHTQFSSELDISSVSSRNLIHETFLAEEGLAAGLVQLRNAMHRGWMEGEKEERRQDEEALTINNNKNNNNSSPSSSLPNLPFSRENNAMAAAKRQKLEPLQQQIYVGFLRAILSGLVDAIEEKKEAKDANARERQLLETCLDGLLREMCFPSEDTSTSTTTTTAISSTLEEITKEKMEENEKENSGCNARVLRSRWAGGFLPALRATPVSLAVDEILAEELCFPRSAVGDFLREELRLCQMEWTRGLIDLSEAARAECLRSLSRFALFAKDLLEQTIGTKEKIKVIDYFEEGAQILRVISKFSEMHDTTISAFQIPSKLQHCVGEISGMRSLVSFIDFKSAARLFAVLQEWLPSCSRLYERALAMLPHNEENEEGEENNKTNHRRLEDAFGEFRARCVAVARGLARDAESSLLLPLYTELLARVFFSSPKKPLGEQAVEEKEKGAQEKQSEEEEEDSRKVGAYKRCLPQLSAVFTALSSSAVSSSVNPGFHEVCQARLAHLLPSYLAEAIAPTSSSSAVKESELIPVIAYSYAQQPLATLQRILGLALAASTVARHCAADPILSETLNSPNASAIPQNSNAASLPVSSASEKETRVSPAEVFFPNLSIAFRALGKGLRFWLTTLREKNRTRGGNTGFNGDVQGSPSAPLFEGGIEKELTRNLAACLRQAIEQFLNHPPAMDPAAAAMSEFFMFLTLLRSSDDGPFGLHAAIPLAFPRTTSSLLRGLHDFIVRSRRYGLAAFFLPPLRALGLEFGALRTSDELVCGMRFPASAAIAALHERPRGFYARPREAPALGVSADARAFLDALLFPKGAEREGETADENGESGLFTAIVVEAGRVVCERLLWEASSGPSKTASGEGTAAKSPTGGAIMVVNSHNTVGIDVLSSLFFGILRFCAQVASEDDEDKNPAKLSGAARRGWLGRTLGRLRQALAEARPSRELTPREARLLDDLWLRFTTPREMGTAGTDETNRNAEEDANTHTSGRSSNRSTEWERWLWSVELEDVDEQPLGCAKALLRSSHANPTTTGTTASLAQGFNDGMVLLRLRASLDEKGEIQKAMRKAAFDKMREALQNDVSVLKKEILDKEPKKKDNTPSTISIAVNKSPVEDSEAQASGDGAGIAQATSGDAKEQELGADMDKNETEKTAETTPDGSDKNTLRLSDAASRKYFAKLIASVVRRALLSPVDGAVAGAAVRHFFLKAARDFFAPLALLAFLRRLIREIARVFMQASRSLLESRSLAILFHHIAEGVVLLYRQNCKSESGWEFAGVLPNSEKEANALFSHTLSELHAMLRFCLAKGTFFGDWAAFFVARHARWLLRPVVKYDEAFQRCIFARREALGRAQIVSLGFQALVKMEKPLLAGMKEPAADVADLFTRSSAAPNTTSVVNASNVTTLTGGRQDRRAPAPLPPADGKRSGVSSRGGDPPVTTTSGRRIESRGDAARETRDRRRWREGLEQRKRERSPEPARGEDAREQRKREPSHKRSRHHHGGRYSRRR